MDLRQLEYFVQIAACGGFNRAAARLHIAQSALSRHIQHLEHELGAALFERSALGVRLTPAGEVAHRRAEVLLQQAKVLKEEVRTRSGVFEGEVGIGIPGILRDLLATPLLTRLNEAHPSLRVTVGTGMSRDIRAGVLGGRFELGVLGTLEPERGLSSVLLHREELLVVGHRDSPIGGRPLLTPEEVLALPLVVLSRETLRALLRALGSNAEIDPARVLEVSDGPLQIELVRQGRYCSILPSLMVREYVERGELHAAQLPGAIYQWRAAWAADRPLSPAARLVLHLLEACASERLASFAERVRPPQARSA